MYLEQREFMERYLNGPESSDFLRSVADVIQALTTDADATTPLGQIAVLHHFLTVTSGGSLLKLRAALESTRRRLLDEMMGSLHRQSRLVQLRFGSNTHERRPELAVGATESQLKGYATLVAAKFPLIVGVKETVRLAYDHLDWVVRRDGIQMTHHPTEEQPELVHQLARLDGQVQHWTALISDLQTNVDSLGQTVERAWMEELLAEQQQTRADQAALAEIERGRLSRPTINRPGGAAYILVVLVLAIAAVIVTVTSSDLKLTGTEGSSWRSVLIALWPVWTFVAVAFGAVPAFGIIWYARNQKRGRQAVYPYEFTFRLDENVVVEKLNAHVGATRSRRIKSKALARRLWVTNRGYGRIDHMSWDSTVVKVHSSVAFRIRAFRYARFEVINEILIHKIASKTQHLLIQCRMLGESPRPLTGATLLALLNVVLSDLLDEIADDDHVNTEALINQSLYGRPRYLLPRLSETVAVTPMSAETVTPDPIGTRT